jgi:hypothetical protein
MTRILAALAFVGAFGLTMLWLPTATQRSATCPKPTSALFCAAQNTERLCDLEGVTNACYLGNHPANPSQGVGNVQDRMGASGMLDHGLADMGMGDIAMGIADAIITEDQRLDAIMNKEAAQ